MVGRNKIFGREYYGKLNTNIHTYFTFILLNASTSSDLILTRQVSSWNACDQGIIYNFFAIYLLKK